jgi:uroporphyrinogen III methyltransferase/synthase
MKGKVWLVGAGPGEPGLITVRGLEVLAQGEVVLHDALVHPALLEACPQAELRNVGKRYGRESPSQNEITTELVELARAGKRVVRLKGGDPFLFARGGEEAQALASAGVEFEIVPGLSSPVATSAYAGIPLTHRELSSSVTFITGSDRAGKQWSPESWKRLATASDTICVLMGMRQIEQITSALIDGGRSADTPAAVIHWGARPEQRVLVASLGSIAKASRDAGLTNPGIIVIGEVVGLREQLRWYDSRPLFGKRLLLLRPAEQAQRAADEVRRRGADPVLFPVIEIVDPPNLEACRRAISELSRYDWIVFTSANGVARFFAQLDLAGLDARVFGQARVAVIGPKTGLALNSRGIKPDLVAEEFVAERLAEQLLEQGEVRRVLLARALVARDTLPEMMQRAGVLTDVVPVYQTRALAPEKQQQLRQLFETKAVDIVLFTASSTVHALAEALGARSHELLRAVTTSAIGPITAKTAADRGVRIDVTAQSYTMEGLLDALELHLKA